MLTLSKSEKVEAAPETLLTAAGKNAVAEQFTADYFVGLDKTADLDTEQLKQLIGELDTWVTDQISAADAAISEPLRSKTSTSTKLAALAFVILKKMDIL